MRNSRREFQLYHAECYAIENNVVLLYDTVVIYPTCITGLHILKVHMEIATEAPYSQSQRVLLRGTAMTS